MIDAIIGRGLMMAASDIKEDILRNCPVDTGFTRTTVDVYAEGNTIIIKAGGAIEYIEFGTPPHVIIPKDKKALYWKGAEHPVKKVMHPGTRANPVIRNAIHRGVLDYIPKRIKQAFKESGMAM
uniref:Putative tail protein n=1 Tax=viral metagenome TaxID=1070528 RepID=A0A6M3L438_9ZZZZ